MRARHVSPHDGLRQARARGVRRSGEVLERLIDEECTPIRLGTADGGAPVSLWPPGQRRAVEPRHAGHVGSRIHQADHGAAHPREVYLLLHAVPGVRANRVRTHLPACGWSKAFAYLRPVDELGIPDGCSRWRIAISMDGRESGDRQHLCGAADVKHEDVYRLRHDG